MKLGIGIPYYKNSEECEIAFKKLMKTLSWQIITETPMVVYEDGQVSEWLVNGYNSGVVKVISNPANKGVGYARNIILNELRKQKVDYILFIDSDDMVDCDYIIKMYNKCLENRYDLIESPFLVNKKPYIYSRRDNVAGAAIRMDLIKDMIFDETVNISEDTLFIHEVYTRKENLERAMIESNYYYNYGINPNSLMMRFERSEIGIKKDER